MENNLKETYLNELRTLREEEIKIINNKKLILKKYEEYINEEYKHLLNKKVEITYTVLGKSPQKDIAYWGGYRIIEFDLIEIPFLYKVKMNGQMSSQRHKLQKEWAEIISIKPVE
jgi:hypothetical protein